VASCKEESSNQLATFKDSLAASEQGSNDESEKLKAIIASLEAELAGSKSLVETLTGQLADEVTKF